MTCKTAWAVQKTHSHQLSPCTRQPVSSQWMTGALVTVAWMRGTWARACCPARCMICSIVPWLISTPYNNRMVSWVRW